MGREFEEGIMGVVRGVPANDVNLNSVIARQERANSMVRGFLGRLWALRDEIEGANPRVDDEGERGNSGVGGALGTAFDEQTVTLDLLADMGAVVTELEVRLLGPQPAQAAGHQQLPINNMPVGDLARGVMDRLTPAEAVEKYLAQQRGR